ncbi:MAG: BLUF domain-containing protein [Rhizobacter sp.]
MPDAAADRPARERGLLALVYVSTATESIGRAEEPVPLLIGWRAHNASVGISGVLLAKDGDLCQYLEGTEPAMTLLYAHICVDRRHRGVIELLREPIERREFPEWPLAFFCAQSYHETRMLPTEEFGRTLFDPRAASRSAGHALLTAFWQAGRTDASG